VGGSIVQASEGLACTRRVSASRALRVICSYQRHVVIRFARAHQVYQADVLVASGGKRNRGTTDLN
jgi:hypothetical protein